MHSQPQYALIEVLKFRESMVADMMITLSEEESNRQFVNFSEMERNILDIVMQAGRELIRQTLEQMDVQILESRDKARYRSKGVRSTSVVTRVGTVEYSRRVYVDMQAEDDKKHCVFLLDKVLAMNKMGRISEEVCTKIAERVCENSFRSSAEIVSEEMADHISYGTVWNFTQKMGERKQEEIKAKAALAEQKKGTGTIETEILYEEADGIWLKLQRKDRQENGTDKEMKVGIAYDGVLKEKCKDGFRSTLDNKTAFASFEKASEFESHKEGVIASVYDMSKVKLRIRNGDGANWIQKPKGFACLCVLDAYHRNNKISRCVKNPETAKHIRELLYNRKIKDLLVYLAKCIQSCEEESEKEKLKELLSYYFENQSALTDYFSREISIPETRMPGLIHHAKLGSMESNVFTIIGNRMKGGRACWSIKGGNHLAILLCAYYTDKQFQAVPIPLPEQSDECPPLSAAKMKETVGKGYEMPHNIHFPPGFKLAREFSQYSF